MTARWTFAVVMGLFVGAAGQAQEMERWIAELGDEDSGRREAATEALRSAGPAARDALSNALVGPESSDPEVRRRIEMLLREVDWIASWDAGGMDLARAAISEMGDAACSCGNADPWIVQPFTAPALARWFPSTRFFRLDWDCCSDKPKRPVLLAVDRAVRRTAFVRDEQGVVQLAHSALPAGSRDEMAEIAEAVLGFLSTTVAGDAVFFPEVRPAEVHAGGRAWVAVVPMESNAFLVVEFDREGRIASCSVEAG